MNFDTKHEVHKNVFSTKIFFTEFGSSDMTAKQEEALFEDFGYPEINLGNLVFEGYYKVDGDKRVVATTEDAADGDKVSFIMNTAHIEVGPNFSASYSCDADDVPASQIGAKMLTTKKLVAEAKCLLFDDVVKKAISETVAAVKKEKTRFETEEVESLNV